MVKFDGTKNRALLSYEDEEEKWHRLGEDPAALTSAKPGFEGTLDSKIKYRVVALAKDGENAVLKYGDETDYQVEDGETFPPIPPALAENRLPKLICNTQVIFHKRLVTSRHRLMLFLDPGSKVVAPAGSQIQATHCRVASAVPLRGRQQNTSASRVRGSVCQALCRCCVGGLLFG